MEIRRLEWSFTESLCRLSSVFLCVPQLLQINVVLDSFIHALKARPRYLIHSSKTARPSNFVLPCVSINSSFLAVRMPCRFLPHPEPWTGFFARYDATQAPAA